MFFFRIQLKQVDVLNQYIGDNSFDRKYLFSRSLLMTTPIDSSFSSQSDDFENLNDSEMSESLIYCLNGNEPACLTPITSCAAPMNVRCIFDGSASSCSTNSCVKRPHTTTSIENICDRNTSRVADMLYADYDCIHPKKNHLELDETAL